MSTHVLEIEIFEPVDNAQAPYLYRGKSDLWWCDSIPEVIQAIQTDLMGGYEKPEDVTRREIEYMEVVKDAQHQIIDLQRKQIAHLEKENHHLQSLVMEHQRSENKFNVGRIGIEDMIDLLKSQGQDYPFVIEQSSDESGYLCRSLKNHCNQVCKKEDG